MVPRDAAGRADTSTILATIRALDLKTNVQSHSRDSDDHHAINHTAVMPLHHRSSRKIANSDTASPALSTKTLDSGNAPLASKHTMKKARSLIKLEHGRGQVSPSPHFGNTSEVSETPRTDESKLEVTCNATSNNVGGTRKRNHLFKSSEGCEEDNVNQMLRMREQLERASVSAAQKTREARDAAITKGQAEVELGMKLLQLYSKDGWVTDLPFHMLSATDKNAVLHALAYEFETTPRVQRSAIKTAGSQRSQARLATRENAKFELGRLAEIPRHVRSSGMPQARNSKYTADDHTEHGLQSKDQIFQWMESAPNNTIIRTEKEHGLGISNTESISAASGMSADHLTYQRVKTAANYAEKIRDEDSIDYISVHSHHSDRSRKYYNSPDPALADHAPISVMYAKSPIPQDAIPRLTPIRNAEFFDRVDAESQRRSGQLGRSGIGHPISRTPQDAEVNGRQSQEILIPSPKGSIPRLRSIFSRSKSLSADSPQVPEIPDEHTSPLGRPSENSSQTSPSLLDRCSIRVRTPSATQESQIGSEKPPISSGSLHTGSLRVRLSPRLFRRSTSAKVSQEDDTNHSEANIRHVNSSSRSPTESTLQGSLPPLDSVSLTVDRIGFAVPAHEMDSPTIPALIYDDDVNLDQDADQQNLGDAALESARVLSRGGKGGRRDCGEADAMDGDRLMVAAPRQSHSPTRSLLQKVDDAVQDWQTHATDDV